MFILDLRTDGNPSLDSDPNCNRNRKNIFLINLQYFIYIDRQHVLDCLSRVWMVDGVFVSSIFLQTNQLNMFCIF